MNQNEHYDYDKENHRLLNRVLKAIADQNIQQYSLLITSTMSDESFYIRKQRTLTRKKWTTRCEVTIYHDFTDAGKDFRGSYSFMTDFNMSEEELSQKIQNAYASAAFVKNPYYPLPKAERIDCGYEPAGPSCQSQPKKIFSGEELAETIFLQEQKEAYLNSLEIFITKETVLIVNSNCVQVSYQDTTYSGEYVVQAKEPQDVELFQDFSYSYLDEDILSSLSDLIAISLKQVLDRAKAVPVSQLPEGMKTAKHLILEGRCVYELFSYYLSRLDASMIYPGYSHAAIGDKIKTNAENTSGESVGSSPVTIKLMPKKPYSNEGIKLVSLPLIENNEIKYLTGNARFSYYLGIPAIGSYDSFELACGTETVKDLETNPYLKIVSFSDFQMDVFTGQFGGEFRLAYFFDGSTVTPVTGGSISGNLTELIDQMKFSSDVQYFDRYCGPLAISYPVKEI